MASRELSIVFKASNRMSADIRAIKGDMNGLSKEIKQYQKIQKETFSEKARLSWDIRDVKGSIRELEKGMKGIKGGTEETDRKLKEMRETWLKQTEALEGLNEEYKRLTMLQKEATQAELNLSNAMSRTDNATAGRNDLLGCLPIMLSQAGIGKMLGDSIGGFLQQEISSGFGSVVGNAIGNISSGVINAAVMGSMLGPVGMVGGALAGGTAGLVQSMAERSGQTNDLFRQEVQSLHSDAMTDVENRVSSGSMLAAERELYQRGFQTTLGKDAGDALYADVKAYGDKTAYDTTQMLGKAKEMLTYGIAGENIMEMMQIVGDIAGGSTTNFSGLSYAISQSMAAGKLNAQDKNQMVNYGLNPLEFVAKDQGISMTEATKMMSDGQISSDMLMDALRLAVSEGERYHDAANAMSDTYEAMMGQLESAWSDLETSAGESYNEKRKEGMAEDIAALTGEAGEKMKEAYAMIGSYEAEMENQYQQSIIKAMEDAATMIEEKGLMGIEAEKAMWEAKTRAEIDYKNSEEYQMKLAAEKSLVEQIQADLTASGDYVRFGSEMANQFSEGFQDTFFAKMNDAGFWSAVDSLFSKNYKGTAGGAAFAPVVNTDGSHASGLQRVPYDGYIAKLHEGERVLTKQQADQSAESGVHIAKLADSIVIREEADIHKIAKAFARELRLAQEVYV